MVYAITSGNIEMSQNKEGSVWKQILVSFIASLPFFTHGIVTNTLSSSAHAGHFIKTPDDVPWSTTALILAAGIAAPIYCFAIDRLGRKIGIYAINLVQGATCIPLFLMPDDITVIFLHTMAGVSSAGLFTVLPTYVREVTCDRERSFTMAFMMIMITTGYLMKLPAGLETMMYLVLVMVAIQLISMTFIMETPSYLVKTKKYKTATKNMASLKNLSVDDPLVLEEINQLKEERDRARSHVDSFLLIAVFRNIVWRDAIKIGIVIYTNLVLCGSILFLDQDKALSRLKLSWDTESQLVLFSLFAGSLFCLLLMRFLERKYIAALAYATMALSMGVLAVYTQNELTVMSTHLVPKVALAVLVFGYGLAWGLPVIIMAEIFNSEIRATLLGVLYAYSQVIKMLHVHTFQYIEDYVGIYAMFYIFAGINIYGTVYSIFGIPYLKGKSVKQIEKQLKRVPLLQFKSAAVKTTPITASLDR